MAQDTREIVINTCYGTFGLSEEGFEYYLKLKGVVFIEYGKSIDRDDKHLVQTVKDLGDKASGRAARLEIIEIPHNADWEIAEHGGDEWVAEKHRTWP